MKKPTFIVLTLQNYGQFVQVPLAQITWYHHISLIPKVKDLTIKHRDTKFFKSKCIIANTAPI